MNIQSQIDSLILSLQNLTVALSNQDSETNKSFSDELQSSIMALQDSLDPTHSPQAMVLQPEPANALSTIKNDPVPDWFDRDNPKRPSTMQLMEIMTGESSDDIFAMDNFKELSKQASDLLYGVIGSKTDKRDWSQIMNSGNIIAELKRQNSAMLEPEVEVLNQFSNIGVPVSSEVVVKDGDGNKLRSIQGTDPQLHQILDNFGVTASSLSTDLNGFDFEVIEAVTRSSLQDFLVKI